MSRALRLCLLFALAAACSEGAPRYEAHGIVRDVHRDLGAVLIEHEDIPGLMPAMTMNFDVPDPALLEQLEKDQLIEFTVEFDGSSYRVVEVEVLGTAGAGEVPGFAGLVASREPAPPFELTDQFGNPRSLVSLRGKLVLLDFIYTTCPGPCPILTSSHVTLQRSLSPQLRERVWFVSISLDPLRDTPTALRRYAEARGADLSDWSFLTGEPERVAEVVASYGVGSVRNSDGKIDHLVVRFLIDAEGNITDRFVGLEHDADELLRGLRRISG